MQGTTSLISNDFDSLLTAKTDAPTKSSTPIFILCDRCYWCATCLSNARISTDNICPQCDANSNQLTSFHIVSNESFTFNYNDKRGVELEFKHM
jgi:hypothetical protein